jgi:hypothetical protein
VPAHELQEFPLRLTCNLSICIDQQANSLSLAVRPMLMVYRQLSSLNYLKSAFSTTALLDNLGIHFHELEPDVRGSETLYENV